jgi:hypothetical protein
MGPPTLKMTSDEFRQSLTATEPPAGSVLGLELLNRPRLMRVQRHPRHEWDDLPARCLQLRVDQTLSG